MKALFITLILLIVPLFTQAQFAGPVGTATTTAIHADSSVFTAWATNCVIVRGLQDIAVNNNTYAAYGLDTNAIGKAGNNTVVSLGDGGSAILTFKNPINNGVGADFAVFENAFQPTFLELAYVEVSSDGINYHRFNATSNIQDTVQIGPFDNLGNATLLNNLAGKYSARYGTPFNLDELQGIAGLNINAITHIKIIDAIGTINPLYASYDINNNKINDPYPTAFASGGFDLDGIGIIHSQTLGTNSVEQSNNIYIYPNPVVNTAIVYSTDAAIKTLSITTIDGITVVQQNSTMLNLQALEAGVYYINTITEDNKIITKKIIKIN
jgi:hypothetical protein